MSMSIRVFPFSCGFMVTDEDHHLCVSCKRVIAPNGNLGYRLASSWAGVLVIVSCEGGLQQTARKAYEMASREIRVKKR